MTYQLTRNGITYQVKLGHWLPRLFGHDAFTLGRTIHVRDAVCPPDLHCHEFTHVEQFDRDPYAFFLLFLWESRRGYPTPPYYGTGNRYEVQAYARELNPSLVATFAALPA